MKQHNNSLGYALLLGSFTLTFTSCFIFQKHKTQTKSNTDSTAYEQTQSSITKHQQEAWNNYLNSFDSSTSHVYFYDGNEPKWIKVDTNGTIEAKGNIKEVVYKSGKQTTKKEEVSLKTDIITKYVKVKADIVKTNNITTTKTVERKSDVMAYVKIFIIIALIAFVWLKLDWIKAKGLGLFGKVINFLKGVFTGI
jgi:hypothetical protein